MRPWIPAILGLLLASCGREGPAPAASSWARARLLGVPGVSGGAVDGNALLLCGAGDDRRLFVVDRTALADRVAATASAMALEVRPEARLAGPDDFAAKGYAARDLWEGPVDLAGVAVLGAGQVLVAERRYRVAYAGSLAQGPESLPIAARLGRVFVLPGAEREGKVRSDWRDTSQGIAGVAARTEGKRAETIFVAERVRPGQGRARVWRTDRFGLVAQHAFVEAGAGPEVAGVAPLPTGLLLLRAGSGGLVSVAEGPWTGDARKAVPESTPPPPPQGSWAAVCRADDGTLYLVSAGPDVWVAWKR